MTTTHHNSKIQRIDVRTTPKIKNTLLYAAEVIGVSLTTFLLEAAYEKAKNLLKGQETITLSAIERDRFLTLLERPAKPNAKLKQAMKKYLNKNK